MSVDFGPSPSRTEDRMPSYSHHIDGSYEGPDIRALCGTQLLGAEMARWVMRCPVCAALGDPGEKRYG